MGNNRSHRLKFLQCFLYESGLFVGEYSDDTFSDPMRSVVSEWNTKKDIINGLLYQDVISSFYSIKCLDVDIWYLTRGQIKNTDGRVTELQEMEQRILFQVILRSLLDIDIGRPCDVSMWRGDQSPDFISCVPTCHICSVSAIEFIKLS